MSMSNKEKYTRIVELRRYQNEQVQALAWCSNTKEVVDIYNSVEDELNRLLIDLLFELIHRD